MTAPPSGPEGGDGGRRSTRTILVVDDDPDIQYMLRFLLESAGFEVHVAGDGEAALRLAESCRPDLITMDLELPDMPGDQVARRMKSNPRLARTPIAAVSAWGEDEAPGRLSNDFVGRLAKPIDPQAFVGSLRALLQPADESAACGNGAGTEPGDE